MFRGFSAGLLAIWLLAAPAFATPQGIQPRVAIGSLGTFAFNNAQLSALPSTFAPGVLRMGYAVAGDSPPLAFAPSATTPSTAPCSLNSGAGDGGSQVPTSDGNCWLWQPKTEPANVRWFGAVGNDSHDDYPAIQAAINAVSPSSGEVFFPQGWYCVKSGTPTVTNQGTTLRGINRQFVTIIDVCGSDAVALKMSGYHDKAINMMIAGSQTLNTVNQAVYLAPGCTECKLEDDLVYYGSNGIYSNSYENYILHTEISFQYGTGPIYMVNTGGYIQRVKMDQAYPYATPASQSLPSTIPNWAASTAYTAGTFVVDGNYLIQAMTSGTSGSTLPTLQKFGVTITDGGLTWQLATNRSQVGVQADTGSGAALYIEDSDFSSNYVNGISLTNTLAGSPPSLVVISNNTFGSLFSSFISLGSGVGVQVEGNTMGGCLMSGCSGITTFGAFSGDLSIVDNQICGVGTGIFIGSGNHTSITGGNVIGGATTAVSIAAGVSGFNVTNNQLGSSARCGNNTNGVFIAAGASDYYTVTGNNFLGVTTALSDGGTGTHKTVSPNP